MSNQLFTDLSYELTQNIDNQTKKQNGIYFTSTLLVNKIINIIILYTENNHLNIQNILEPSCGSCEFICVLDQEFDDVKIVGIENNEYIYMKL